MSDALDRLHDQLHATFMQPKRRWAWRRHGVALALAIGVSASGVAVAATQIIGGGQSAETQGRKIALQAVRDTDSSPACRTGTQRGASGARIAPALRAALPLLGTPPTPLDAVGRPGVYGSAVIPDSVHVVNVGEDLRLTVYVEDGGTARASDPAACLVERRDRAAELLIDRPAGVREWTTRRLNQLTDTAPGLQMLFISTRRQGSRGSRGVGLPVGPGRPLPRGIVNFGGGEYTAIASPRAARVQLDPARGERKEVRVVGGLWAARLPRETGRVAVRERDATGRVVARYTLRE